MNLYDQDSLRVPAFYNRVGPAEYDNNKNIDKLSNHVKSVGTVFSKDGIARAGYYKCQDLPKHRFYDYSKKVINNLLDL